jgi:hypothetical protein
MKKVENNSAQFAEFSKSHLTKTYEELTGPFVGEAWPELKAEDVTWPDTNEVSFNYESSTQQIGNTRRVVVRLRLKTRIFVIALLAMVIGYAMYKGDPELIRNVLRVIEPGVAPPSVLQSSPDVSAGVHERRSHRGKK